MSDRASARYTFYHVPPEDAAKVVAFLMEYADAIEWSEQMPTDAVVIGAGYTVEEVTLGVHDEIYAALKDTGVYYSCYQDPKYEWDGQVEYFTPILGRFTAYCNSAGDVYFTQYQLQEVFASHADDSLQDFLKGPWRELTGVAWLEAFQAFENDGITEVAVPTDESE